MPGPYDVKKAGIVHKTESKHADLVKWTKTALDQTQKAAITTW